MSTLIENLHNNNVIFSYYGFIDNSVLNEVLQITKSKLEGNNEKPMIIGKIHDAISECVDNIIKHNFYPDDERVRYKSLLVVSKQQGDYSIDTINVVNSHQKESINQQLDYLHSKSKDELSAIRSKNIIQAENTNSMGLVDLLLKADTCDCTFKNIDSNYLFNINFKISSMN
ncbi:MAG: hypothetical protein JNL60_07705 [Bacteroidia bacterium]|nr:hypothetical protein [Bacteroidia bacterium]